MNILVDSSIWVEVLRNKNSRLSSVLRRLISERRAFVTGVIKTEILPFVQEPKQERLITELFSALPVLEIEPVAHFWQRTIFWRSLLNQHGLGTLGLPDAMIATVALEKNVALWSLDKHFRLIAEKLPLQTIQLVP